LASAGFLRLLVLRLDGEPVAAYYGFVAKGRASYYIGGFDPAHAALGPGTLLIGQAIEDAHGEGCHAFDFLSGREGYKYLWGARDEPTFALRLEPPPRTRPGPGPSRARDRTDMHMPTVAPGSVPARIDPGA